MSFAVCAGINVDKEEQRERLKSLGLVADHAYAVTGAECVTSSTDENCNIVRVRNPWGNFEWKGDWSDGSDKWTEATRSTCQVSEAKDDGSFWMDVKDFMKYFCYVHVAHIQEGCTLSGVRTANDQFQIATFNVPEGEDLKITLSVTQRSKRSFPSNSGYEYSDARIFLVKMKSPDDYRDLANAELEYIGGGVSVM